MRFSSNLYFWGCPSCVPAACPTTGFGSSVNKYAWELQLLSQMFNFWHDPTVHKTKHNYIIALFAAFFGHSFLLNLNVEERPQHSNINGKKTEHFWFQGLSLHHHAISIKFLRMGLPRACPSNQRAPPVDTEKTSEPIIGSLFGRCNKHTHASYVGKPPRLLPVFDQRWVSGWVGGWLGVIYFWGRVYTMHACQCCMYTTCSH